MTYCSMFKSSNEIGQSVSSYNVKVNVRNLHAVAKEIFGNLRDKNPLNLMFYLLDYVVEDRSKPDMLNYRIEFLTKTYIPSPKHL